MTMDCSFHHRISALLVVGALFLLAIPMTSHATEEPDYQVVKKLEDAEVRLYAAYTVAEVVVPSHSLAGG